MLDWLFPDAWPGLCWVWGRRHNFCPPSISILSPRQTSLINPSAPAPSLDSDPITQSPGQPLEVGEGSAPQPVALRAQGLCVRPSRVLRQLGEEPEAGWGPGSVDLTPPTAGCRCDVGGALGQGCEPQTGACRCRPKTQGPTCSEWVPHPDRAV